MLSFKSHLQLFAGPGVSISIDADYLGEFLRLQSG
jgi:hypothetical protein